MPSGEAISPPEITGNEPFDVLVGKFSLCVLLRHQGRLPPSAAVSPSADKDTSHVVKAVDATHSFEELRSARYGKTLVPLVQYLTDEVQHRLTVAALL